MPFIKTFKISMDLISLPVTMIIEEKNEFPTNSVE